MARRRRRNSNMMLIPMVIMFVIILVLIVAILFKVLGRSNSALKKAEVHTEDLIDESGNVIGKHGYIEINSSDMQKINEKQFASFTEKVVKADEYALFTIKLSNGTGIAFTDGDDKEIRYGYLDPTGQLSEIFGFVVKNKDGSYEYQQY